MFTLKKNSLNIKYKDLDHWLAICGYIPPLTDGDLIRYDKLYSEFNGNFSVNDLDFESIWDDKDQFDANKIEKIVLFDFTQLRAAARGLNDLPEKIKLKILSNQKQYG